jgi:hypothetical protein
MSKVIVFIILGGLVFAAITVINISGVDAYEDAGFIPVSVLSKKQADYSADKNQVVIPAVSMDILEDKAHDIESTSSVPIIKYTSLPVKDQGSTGPDNNEAQTVDKTKDKNDPGNNGSANSSQQSGNGQTHENNGNANPNQSGNGSGTNNGNGNSTANTDKGSDNKPDKGSTQQDNNTEIENKNSAPDQSNKVK